jgi:hypothetical protein
LASSAGRRTWRTLWYGNEAPSLLRKVAINGLILSLVLLLYAVFLGEFIPSEAWSYWGLRASLLLTAIVMSFIYWRVATGRVALPQTSPRLSKTGAMLTMPVVVFGYLWINVVYGLPDVITWLTGEPVRVRTVLTTVERKGDRRCACRLAGYRLEGKLIPSYSCFSEYRCSQLPERFEAVLEARRTLLGLRITDVFGVADPASAAQ